MLGGVGATAGPHRLWTHQAYKAKWQLRVILGVLYASAGMVDVYNYCFIRFMQDKKIFLLQLNSFRTTFMNGYEIIGCTTSIRIRMQIRTTVIEGSFSLTSVGWWWKNIQMWFEEVVRWIWAMYWLILLLHSTSSKFVQRVNYAK